MLLECRVPVGFDLIAVVFRAGKVVEIDQKGRIHLVANGGSRSLVIEDSRIEHEVSSLYGPLVAGAGHLSEEDPPVLRLTEYEERVIALRPAHEALAVRVDQLGLHREDGFAAIVVEMIDRTGGFEPLNESRIVGLPQMQGFGNVAEYVSGVGQDARTRELPGHPEGTEGIHCLGG